MNIIFKDGVLNVSDKKEAIMLCFLPSCDGSEIYNSVEKSLPKINGLKRKAKRMEFTFDLIKEMRKNGIKIIV